MSNLNLDFIKTNVTDDPAFIQELLSVFLMSLEEDVPALKKAVETADHEQIRQDAHKVKSGFRSLGMQEMTDYLQGLENMGKNSESINAINERFQGFMERLPMVVAEVKAYPNSAS